MSAYTSVGAYCTGEWTSMEVIHCTLVICSVSSLLSSNYKKRVKCNIHYGLASNNFQLCQLTNDISHQSEVNLFKLKL